MIDENIIPLDLCPCCGYSFDRASSLEPGTKPQTGDISLCISCGGVLEFDKDLKHVVSSDWQDKLEAVQLHQIRLMQNIIQRRGPVKTKAVVVRA